MNSLDIHHIEQILQQWTGARFKNFYHDKEKIVLQLHKEKTITIHITPTQIYEEEKGTMPEKPTPLAQTIRNNLEGTKLGSVEQIGTERIIQLTFKGAKTTRTLVIELFSMGNTLLLNENKTIIIAKTYKEWKDRTIKKGESYRLPPQQKNILETTPEKLKKESEKYDNNYEKTLALAYGLGGEIAKKITTETTQNNPKSIIEAFTSIWNKEPPENSLKLQVESSKIQVSHSQLTNKEAEKRLQIEKKKEQINKRIKMQEERLQELEKEAEENKRKGELIYENYALIKKEIEQSKKEFTLQL